MRYGFALLFVFLVSFNLSAEEPRLGKTEDGQAYRVDSEGNQIVDYIAELELNVDTLQRQVYALENEAKQKQQLVEKMQARQEGGYAPELIEKGAETEKCVPQVIEVPKVIEKIVEREVIKPQLPEFDVKEAKQNCEEEVSAIKTSYQSSLDKQQSLLSECRNTLNEERERGAASLSKNASYLTDSERSINELKATLERKNSEISDLKQKLAATKEIANVKQIAISETEGAEAPRASIAYRESLTEREGSRQRTALVVARERAVDSLRGKILTELNSLRNLISNRDTLFATFKSKNHALSFTPSPARTKDGRDLSNIQHELRTAENVNQLSFLSRDIREVRAKIEDDISVVRRAGQ